MIHNKVCVATHKWWDLTAREKILLSALIGSLSPCTSRDIPVFLPDGSPKVCEVGGGWGVGSCVGDFVYNHVI